MKSKIVNFVLLFFIFFNVLLILLFLYFMSPVGDDKDVSFIIDEGSSLSVISKKLENEGLVKNGKFFFIYSILTGNRNIYAAKYELNSSMKVSEISSVLKSGGVNPNEVTVTFKEGLNMRQIAKVISSNTNIGYDEVINKSNDAIYIDSLIKKYWFITKDVKNSNIYYKLEGYLFPDSYNFDKNVTCEEIFNELIAHMDKKLSPYKKDIEKSGYSVHQILTMASILELEGVDESSRRDIAGVFYNRLNKKMNLGSDVTSYYGVKKAMTVDIFESELNDSNPYNTRIGTSRLPVGPIDNPSLVSIKAALNPSKHDYYYFVADKNGKVYLTKDYETHNEVVADLKNKGLWFEW
ncbi:MAG: endolytic transglycosylase MltG [bacterium]|nr:endolytic transglycosylase MltG [bacterium]